MIERMRNLDRKLCNDASHGFLQIQPQQETVGAQEKEVKEAREQTGPSVEETFLQMVAQERVYRGPDILPEPMILGCTLPIF